MRNQNKALAGCDPSQGCDCLESCLTCLCNKTHKQKAAPYMGSALRALLKRYSNDLKPYAVATGDRVATSMVDCCNFLLIEADRLERVRS